MGKLWYGGKIYTLTEPNATVEAIYTENGSIVEIGNKVSLERRYKNKIEASYNLIGDTMYPGFVDSHLHIIGHGEKLTRLDLSPMTSANQVLEAVRNKQHQLEHGEWLIAEGWNENQWTNAKIISRWDLDKACPKNPVLLTRICRHAVIVNSKALELACITKETKDPQGGKIVRNEMGEPTGYLLDKAQDLIKQILSPISNSQLEKTTEVAIKDLLSKGLVGGHTEDLSYYGGFERTLQAYQHILPAKYKFRAHLLVHHLVFDDMIESGLSYGDGGPFTTLGAMKIFSDGALGGRTAWLTDVYTDDQDNYGIPIHESDRLEELVRKARKYDHPIAVHAIGDKAVEEVAKLIKKYPLKNGKRDRIIHAQIINKNVLSLLKEINVVLDIQPSFVSSDFPWVLERIGDERAPLAYAWRTFIEEGIACAAGSDAPIEEVNPLNGIKAAVSRQSDLDQQVYGETQKLSMYEAVSLYTKGSAFVINHEHDRGLIQPGYVADFTILSHDLFSIENYETIDEVTVKGTIVDGEWMYKA